MTNSQHVHYGEWPQNLHSPTPYLPIKKGRSIPIYCIVSMHISTFFEFMSEIFKQAETYRFHQKIDFFWSISNPIPTKLNIQFKKKIFFLKLSSFPERESFFPNLIRNPLSHRKTLVLLKRRSLKSVFHGKQNTFFFEFFLFSALFVIVSFCVLIFFYQ